MKLLWKGAAAAMLAMVGLGSALPAHAQYHGDRHGNGWRGDRDYRDGRRWDRDRRWESRRNWRGADRRHWDRGYDRRYRTGYRQRCWNELRYVPYSSRTVRVRICN